jgi:UDP-2,3-diacylglucosamine hydrolase
MAHAGRVLFTSDIHLTPEQPEIFLAFLRFLDDVASGAEALYILGDLFDFWVGEAQLDVPGYGEVFRRIRRLADDGTAVFFLAGNRDFVLDGPFAEARGLTLLPDVAEVALGDRRAILTHGDLLCTRDVRYLGMRRVLRSRPVRGLLHRLPGRLVLSLAERLRKTSEREIAAKPAWVMAPDFREARAWLERRGCDTLIFGHVHWGERYRLALGAGEADVIVLGSWEHVPNYAEWDGSDLRLVSYDAADPAPAAG